VARVGSSVILSGPMPAGEAVNCVAVGEDPPTTPGAWHGSRSSCSSAAGAAHEFEVPASHMAHA